MGLKNQQNGVKNEIVTSYLKLIQMTSNLHGGHGLRRGMVQGHNLTSDSMTSPDVTTTSSGTKSTKKADVGTFFPTAIIKMLFFGKRITKHKKKGPIITFYWEV